MTYTTSPDVPDFATLDNIIQSSHDFLSWSITIKSMNLQDIDIRPQSCNTLVDRIQNMFSAQAHLIDHRTIISSRRSNRRLRSIFLNPEVAFAQDHNLVSWYFVLFDGFADDLFRLSVGVNICTVIESVWNPPEVR